MFIKGGFILIVFLLSLQISFAQDSNQCLLVNENNVDEAASRIWNAFSSLGLEAALSAVDSLQPGDNGYEFKEELKEALRKKNTKGLGINKGIMLFEDGKEHENCDCSYVSLGKGRLIAYSIEGEEIDIKFFYNAPILEFGPNDSFRITIKDGTKIVISNRDNEGKIPLFEIFTFGEENKIIGTIFNGALNFDVKNDGSFHSDFVYKEGIRTQSTPIEIIVYKIDKRLFFFGGKTKIRNNVISNYNEFIIPQDPQDPITEDYIGDIFFYEKLIKSDEYRHFLLKSNNIPLLKEQVEDCANVTINDRTQYGLTEELTKKLFDQINRISPGITRDTTINIISQDVLNTEIPESVRDAAAFVIRSKLGEIFLVESNLVGMLRDLGGIPSVIPHEYTHVLANKIISSQIPELYPEISDLQEKVLSGDIDGSEGIEKIRSLERRSEFIKEWLEIAGDVYGDKYLHIRRALLLRPWDFLYKNEDGTIDEESSSGGSEHAKSKYGTIGPYGLIDYHEDSATIIGDYYVFRPVMHRLYKEDDIIRQKIDYLHSYGFFTDEQLEIIQTPPIDEAYFWREQSPIYISDCVNERF